MSKNILQEAIENATPHVNYEFGDPVVVLEKDEAEGFLTVFQELLRSADAINCMVESPDNLTTQVYDRDFRAARHVAHQWLGEIEVPTQVDSDQQKLSHLLIALGQELEEREFSEAWPMWAMEEINMLVSMLFGVALKHEANERLESRHIQREFAFRTLSDRKKTSDAMLKRANTALEHLADELQGRMDEGEFGKGHYDTAYWRQLISVAKDPKELVTLEESTEGDNDDRE